MFSYWEKQSFFHYDVIVIGGGITGLSTAISLKEKKPALQVAVLERGVIPSGASLRNAGFACIGSFTEIWDDLQNMPEEKIFSLIELRKTGLDILRKRLGDKAIGYFEKGSYELIMEDDLPLLEKLNEVNQWLYPLLKGNAFSLCNEKMNEFGFEKNLVKAIIRNHYEGELNTGKMMYELIQFALKKGIEIKTGCEVEKITDHGNSVQITLKQTIENDQPILLNSFRAAICTNAYTKKLLPDVDLKPGRGQVLITEVIPNLPFKGIFHFDKGYYYFREIDGRILFGGGRITDKEGETTTEAKLNEPIQQLLGKKLNTLILPGKKVNIANRWAGIMAFGEDKFPLIQQYSQKLFMAVRMGGMGIAIGSKAGEMLADLILEKLDE